MITQRRNFLKTMLPVVPVLIGLLWLGGVFKGMTLLWDYQNAPGKSGSSPVRWPLESGVPRSPDRPTLVMMMHPHCPCSRASLGELEILMTRLQGRISACVLFYKPKGFGKTWEKTDLWQSASRIPGVNVLNDEEGMESRRFGASTSGQALVYDRTGRLLFSGGITPSRGHLGENAGVQAIVSLVREGRASHSSTPVYGCSLGTPLKRASWK